MIANSADGMLPEYNDNKKYFITKQNYCIIWYCFDELYCYFLIDIWEDLLYVTVYYKSLSMCNNMLFNFSYVYEIYNGAWQHTVIFSPKQKKKRLGLNIFTNQCTIVREGSRKKIL